MAEASFKDRQDDERADNFAIYRRADENVIDLSPYLSILWSSRRSIAVYVLLTMVLTVVIATFMLRKTYRALAIIRPVAKAATAGRVAGMFAGVAAGSSPLAALVGGGGGQGADEAQEYMTILQTFAFNVSLINQHHLSRELFKASKFTLLRTLSNGDPRWRNYESMMKWFSCEYSIKTGNITLYFEANTPSEAEEILGYYVDDLREKLRSREVLSTEAAITSMKTEARVTSDSLLQAQLYELIARQMQQLRLAQVEADFAFTVLEPPAASDKPYRPKTLLDAALVGLLAFILACTAAIRREFNVRDSEPRALQSQSGHANQRRVAANRL